MYKIITTGIIVVFLSLTACNNNAAKTVETATIDNNTAPYSCPMHHEIVGIKGDRCSKCGMELIEHVDGNTEEHEHDGDKHDGDDLNKVDDSKKGSTATEDTKNKVESISNTTTQPFSIQEIVSNYLEIKNAFTKDDSKAAANAANVMYGTLKAISANTLDSKQQKEYLEIVETAKEHAEHIGTNGGKIDHQREHFIMLSKDVNDLVATFGTKQKLYQDFCPMANDNKGAIWISETKEIKNPYFGAKMPKCGKIKKEY